MTTNGYIESNGVNYYYEVHGEGEPLLLLHGGLGSIDMFLPDLPALSAKRQVIAVDLQGHGRSSLGDRPIRLEDIADDMAVIVKSLGHEQVDAVGYSFGAGVVFRLAVQHPSVVRRLVLISAGYSTDGFHPEMRPQQAQLSGAGAEFMKDSPMYLNYAAVAPNVDDFPRLLDAMGEFMRADYNFAEDVKSLTMPVMLIFGDHDMFTAPHMAEFFNLLGGNTKDAGWQRENMDSNRLAVIPNRTHYDMTEAPELVPTILGFVC